MTLVYIGFRLERRTGTVHIIHCVTDCACVSLLLRNSIFTLQAHCQAKDRGIRYPWVQFLDEFDVVVFNTGLHPVGSFKRLIYRTKISVLRSMLAGT